MGIPLRVILVLAIALQGLLGLRGASCAGMEPVCGVQTAAPGMDPEVCPCCAGGSNDGALAANDGAMPARGVCGCSGRQPEPRPTTPAPDHKDLQFSLVWLPLVGTALPDPAICGGAARAAAESSPRCPRDAVRPLLCVWVV